MKKWKASDGRLIVRSRGTKNDFGGIIVLDKNLQDSNMVEVIDSARGAGSKIYGIRRDDAGHALGEHEYIIDKKDFIGEILADGRLVVAEGWVHVRKCKDPEEEIITSLSSNKSSFAEIVCGGEKTSSKMYTGWFASIKADAVTPQRLEETEHDWLVMESEITFICEETI